MTDDVITTHQAGTADEAASERTGARRFVVGLCWLAIVVGVIARFAPRSDLWLDEALSVNISKLPLGDIGEALRHDGHPPLYYYLLHGWMQIGGESDWWVRALSGLFGVASIPLGYIAGARISRRSGDDPGRTQLAALLTAAMVAVIPYGVRYGSETRMYSLLITLVLAGYLLIDDLFRNRRSGRAEWLTAVGAALVTAVLLWTQYWSMWLLATVGLIALWRLWRPPPTGRRGVWFAVGSLVAGGILFLPWVPALLYQSAHTGTPWGDVIRPTTVLLVTIIEFAGRPVAEPQLLSYVLVMMVVLGVFGVVVNRRRGDGSAAEAVQIAPGTTPRIRYELTVVVGTLAVGSVASVATSATYQSRYASVVFPLFCLCVAAGLSVLRGVRTLAAVLVVVLVGSFVTIGMEVTSDRTQAGVVADQIVADAGDDPADAVVITCPDQLSPATDRALHERTGHDWEVIPFPTGGTPERIDWVDYEQRNEAATDESFIAEQAERITPDTTVYLVFTPGYNTFGSKCEGLDAALSETHVRDPAVQAEPDGDTYFENMGLWVYRPRT